MIFDAGELPGIVVIRPECHSDDRGFFARTWCAREFEAHGLSSTLAQASVSWNEHRHTLRGMHWEAPPHRESKLVRATRGSIFDVVVDLRPASATYLQYMSIRLAADEHTALWIPHGFAHGFLTLEDRTEVLYQMDSFYAQEAERGARFDEPAFGIDWPAPPAVISRRDRSFPDFVVDPAVGVR